MLGRRDADGASRLLAQFRDGRNFGVDFFEPRPDGPQEPLARFGRRDAARGTGQKPDAQPRLKLADGLAECRLRDAQLGGRFVKLRSRPTATRARRSSKCPRCIYQLRLWALEDFSA